MLKNTLEPNKTYLEFYKGIAVLILYINSGINETIILNGPYLNTFMFLLNTKISNCEKLKNLHKIDALEGCSEDLITKRKRKLEEVDKKILLNIWQNVLKLVEKCNKK